MCYCPPKQVLTAARKRFHLKVNLLAETICCFVFVLFAVVFLSAKRKHLVGNKVKVFLYKVVNGTMEGSFIIQPCSQMFS